MEQSENNTPTPPGLSSQVLRIVAKDLRVEWRSREIVYTISLFAVLVVLIFAFAVAHESVPMQEVAGGILWVVVIFAGTLGLSRFFDREREGDTLRALQLSPLSPGALYLAKLIGVLVFILCTELLVVPLLVLLFGLQIASLGLLVLLLLLGSIGFAAIGSLFAASLMQSRNRDVLLGILLFPIATPIVIAGAKGTAAVLTGIDSTAQALFWIKLILVFDAVFVTLSMWIFGPLTRSD